jgi:hypothetical protein
MKDETCKPFEESIQKQSLTDNASSMYPIQNQMRSPSVMNSGQYNDNTFL